MASQLETIREILLEHKGKSNPITSAQMAEALGFNEDDTHATTRSLILESAEKYSIPLAADNRGYYVITSDKEYSDYMKNLDSRQQGIEKRKEIITKNYKGE